MHGIQGGSPEKGYFSDFTKSLLTSKCRIDAVWICVDIIVIDTTYRGDN